jgi:hypothetical protein
MSLRERHKAFTAQLKEEARDFIVAHPEMSLAELALALGVSTGYIIDVRAFYKMTPRKSGRRFKKSSGAR